MSVVTFTGDQYAKIVGSVAIAASLDGSRPHLNAVHFGVKDHQLSVAGTNGHWLAFWELKNFAPDADDASALIPLSAIKRSLRYAGRSESQRASKVVLDFGANTISAEHDTAESKKTLVAKYKPVDASFPPYHQIVPAVSDRHHTAGFSLGKDVFPKVFEAFAIAHMDLGDFETWAVCMESTAQPLDPIVCSSVYAPEFLVVAMPCKADRAPRRMPPKTAESAAAE